MISVIIPTYNEEKNIERCLISLNKQSLPRINYELIVVDGESKDRTIEIAKNLADKVILQVSKGVGGARNDGVKISNGKIIITTDADCQPHHDWIKNIWNHLKDKNNVAVTGILIPFDFDNMKNHEVFIYKTLFHLSNILLFLLAKARYYHMCGANSAFQREAFLEIKGYLDIDYSDDVEIYKRIKKKGKIILDRKTKVNYSVRRIKTIGLINYIYLIIKNDFTTMILNMKPTKGNYSKQKYD